MKGFIFLGLMLCADLVQSQDLLIGDDIFNNQFIPYNYEMGQRSQDLEPLYYENGLLYIFKTALLNQGKLLGEQNYSLIVDHPFAEIDIDTEADFKKAEFFLNVYKS